MTINYYVNDIPNNLKLPDQIAIDTEAMGLNNHRDRLCLVQISGGDGSAHLIHFLNKNYSAPNLKKVLSDKSKLKIFHFARFDVGILQHYLDISMQNIYCTKIASRLVRTYTDYHSLKDLCLELLGVKISKQQQSSDWGAQKLSQEQLEYAANDVLHLHKLKEQLDNLLKRENRLEIAQKCFDFIPTRSLMDVLGWPEEFLAH